MPAQKRSQLLISWLQIHQGLIIELELVSPERLAQVELHGVARLGARIHLGLENAHGTRCSLLRPGWPSRFFQELFGSLPYSARRKFRLVTSTRMLCPSSSQGLVIASRTRRASVAGSGTTWCDLKHAEFVAAQSRDHIRIPEAIPQAAGHQAQELVAGGASERVVDVLEVVDIDMKNGESLIPPQPRQGSIEPVAKQGAIGRSVTPS